VIGGPQRLIDRLVSRLDLRFPGLFVLFVALTALDLIVPDMLPFVDEIGLALLAAMFGLWRRRRPATASSR
jgi:hypothetical protein